MRTIRCLTTFQNSFILILFYLSLFLYSVIAAEWINVAQESVDIKPGAGLQEITQKAGKHTCRFSYKAQGGTKESWSFEVQKSSPAGRWSCTVKRPSGVSYLFFEEFTFELSSGHLQNVHLEKQPDTVLAENEYIVDAHSRTVKHRPGSFKSQLNSIQVQFSNKPEAKARDL